MVTFRKRGDKWQARMQRYEKKGPPVKRANKVTVVFICAFGKRLSATSLLKHGISSYGQILNAQV